MPSTKIVLDERDIVCLICDFLQRRNLDLSTATIERETGIVNGNFCDDLLFLRQLILDGRYDEALDFSEPLEQINGYDSSAVKFIVLKHKYIEMLCLQNDLRINQDIETSSANNIMDVMNAIEPVCPSREEFNELCLMMTLKDINDHPHFCDWNPASARANCFKLLQPLIEDYLPPEMNSVKKKKQFHADNDRLIQLVIKGLLYEACVEFCQRRATSKYNGSGDDNDDDIKVEILSLINSKSQWLSDADISLTSWLEALPTNLFTCPFQQKNLKLDIAGLKKPKLENSWSEQILSNPIKPKVFPYTAMPAHLTSRKTIDPLTSSLAPQYDGLPSGLKSSHQRQKADDNLSRSFAGFRLNSINKTNMMASVDKLFLNQEFTDNNKKKTDMIPKISETNDTSTSPISPVFSETSNPLKNDFLETKICDNEKNINADCGTNDKKSIINSLKNCDQNNIENSLQKSKTPDSCRSTNSKITKPQFVNVTSIEDQQAIRTVCIHPNGAVYAVGSNSKLLRICKFPDLTDLREGTESYSAKVLLTKCKYHKGSIYCTAWSSHGDLLATGSNDKIVKLLGFDPQTLIPTGVEHEIALHDGTVRDVTFMNNGTSTCILSGGAGTCSVYATDCNTLQKIRSFDGHTGHIYSLNSWRENLFVSGSQDKTARLWDSRLLTPVTIIKSPNTGSAFSSISMDPSGRLLASGHEDASVMLWDTTGNRVVKIFQPHTDEVKSTVFSANAYYLLTASYDKTVVLTDLHGDLVQRLPSVVIAEHSDKVICASWHPSLLSFATASADKSAIVWALPLI